MQLPLTKENHRIDKVAESCQDIFHWGRMLRMELSEEPSTHLEIDNELPKAVSSCQRTNLELTKKATPAESTI